MLLPVNSDRQERNWSDKATALIEVVASDQAGRHAFGAATAAMCRDHAAIRSACMPGRR